MGIRERRTERHGADGDGGSWWFVAEVVGVVKVVVKLAMTTTTCGWQVPRGATACIVHLAERASQRDRIAGPKGHGLDQTGKAR